MHLGLVEPKTVYITSHDGCSFAFQIHTSVCVYINISKGEEMDKKSVEQVSSAAGESPAVDDVESIPRLDSMGEDGSFFVGR